MNVEQESYEYNRRPYVIHIYFLRKVENFMKNIKIHLCIITDNQQDCGKDRGKQ